MRFDAMAAAGFAFGAALFLGGAAPGLATTYTVTSQSALVTDLGKVNPGDVIDITGTIHLSGYPVEITRSGNSSLPITIQSTPGQTAVINGTGIYESPYVSFDLNANYVVIQNLTFTDGQANNLLFDGNNGTGSYDTANNCTFEYSQWAGVSIGGSGDNNFMTNDVIENCSVHDNNQTNLNGNGANWAGSLELGSCQWSTVQNNKVYHNWGEGLGSYSMASGETNHNYIIANTIYDNWSVELYLADSSYNYCESNFIYADGNAIYRQGYPAIGIASDNEDPNILNKGSELLNNIVIGGMWCFRAANQHSVSGFYAGGLNGYAIYNNVFYNTGGQGCIYIDNDPNNSFAWSNNISWETNNSATLAYNGGGNNGGIWTNCWDGNGANNMMSWGSDIAIANANPGFASAGSLSPSGWVLNSNSQLYSAGSNISYLFNFDFNSPSTGNWSDRPSSGAWTMGAFYN